MYIFAHTKVLLPLTIVYNGHPQGWPVDSIWDRRSVGMVVGRRDIKELRHDEEEAVLRWAAATDFDIEGALEVLKEQYYSAMGAWEL